MGNTDTDSGESYLGRRSETCRKRNSDGGHTKKRKYSSSSEEEIAVYMVRKAQKKAARLLAAGYSNALGESNLSEKFVWKKKIERDVSVHGAPSYSRVYKAEKRRQKEIMAEIEKLKRRRQGRVVEKAAAARVEGGEFEEKKEKEFELEQSKLRSEIRFREGRAKPIDILTKSVSSEVDLDLDLVFKGLTVKELEEVRDEIKLKLDLDLDLDLEEKDTEYYWKAVLELCNWEIATVSLKEISCSWGLHPSIEEDMRDYLQRKSYRDLEEIQCRGEEELNSGKGKIAEFWQDTLKRIQLYKAIAYLREFHNAKISMNHDHNPNLQPAADDVSVTAMEEEEEEEGLRKPRYVTKVLTGYAWNKYNQTHYDHENPPPKVVKGYKLNIFYPELVEAVPTYTIEKDDESSSGETCIIRFHAGHPYQDIAFRIVNGDWELSVNKGFKSIFHGGILRLYFNFKRYHYRR